MSSEARPIDLDEVLTRINEKFFGFDELPAIVWSRGRIQRKYRKLTLGTYDWKANKIRVHPLFREGHLPEFVLEFVVYHELLHYEDREKLQNRRRRRDRVHDSDFHKREKEFPRKARRRSSSGS
jgi:hypothetical protein